MIHHGDLFDVLPTIADESIDACVTDPPYGIGFMGKEWDTFKPGTGATRRLMHPRERVAAKIVSANPNIDGRHRSPALSPSQIDYDYSVAGLRGFQDWTAQWAAEVFRVLKPGGYIVVCCAPRSYHRMACGLEDAGFVIRDKFSWLFGSGFPKNHNLGEGKGTALKPAHEPIALAWKPFKGTIENCHKQHGTAALNIDACRIGEVSTIVDRGRPSAEIGYQGGGSAPAITGSEFGRWPANVVIDDVAAAAIDEQTGILQAGASPAKKGLGSSRVYGDADRAGVDKVREQLDSGGASRFYYCAKPSREERDMGCYDLTPKQRDDSRKEGNPGGDNPRNRGLQPRGNYHPTVKPVDLMRWLVKLVTPIGGVVLDPFGGSFTTAMACVYEDRKFEIIEREAEYVEIGVRRVRAVSPLLIDPAALEVRRYDAVHSPRDVRADGTPDQEAQDSTTNHSACPDPDDAVADAKAAARE